MGTLPYIMQDYDNALADIMDKGVWHSNKRTGVRTKSIFGVQCRYNLTIDQRITDDKMFLTFPILTKRKVWPKSVFAELIWFLSGSTNVKDLNALGASYWDAWANKDGELGKVYGYQLIHWESDPTKVVEVKQKKCLHEANISKCSGYTELKTDLDKNIKKIWLNMMDRCYNSSCFCYKDYGGTGITVCPLWFNFDNFYNDVRSLPQWTNKKNNPNAYRLDKDYYNSKCYCKDTCVWLHHQDNILYKKDLKPFIVTYPNGHKSIEISITRFAEQNRLKYQGIQRVLNKERKKHRNYKFEYLNNDKLYRYQLPINQLDYIINRIKTDKSCRRILFSLWNPANLDEMALAPCAYAFQVLIDDDGNMTGVLTQRSADMPVGVPANIQFYAAFTCMLAQQTGYKPYELVHHMADAHIYENQFEGVETYLRRPQISSPILCLRKAKDIYSYYPNNFSLTAWESLGKIDFPVAV